MIVIIDNYDSFTYNLYQLLGELSIPLKVIRNDALTVEQIKELKPHGIVISPGPGHPAKAGICVELIQQLSSSIPILGVCLGHQAIALAFGATIISAPEICHGKDSYISHSNGMLFNNLPQQLLVGRYHSLAVSPNQLPTELIIEAIAADKMVDRAADKMVDRATDKTADRIKDKMVDKTVDKAVNNTIMALRHANYPCYGVQFHPESILTPEGSVILANFVEFCRKHHLNKNKSK